MGSWGSCVAPRWSIRALNWALWVHRWSVWALEGAVQSERSRSPYVNVNLSLCASREGPTCLLLHAGHRFSTTALDQKGTLDPLQLSG